MTRYRRILCCCVCGDVMRVLRIEANGLFLFNEIIVIDFYAEQRVYPDNSAMLYNTFGNTLVNISVLFYQKICHTII